ncbi:MAG: hypothetical protein HKN87_09055 [Saprospiraceae bacterium]|nr:hypothetical protein [Saprospiraceae bacterium]
MANRREALRNLVLAAAGISLFPACDFEQVPIYSRIPLAKKQYRTLEQLTQNLLPTEGIPVETPERTVDYLLTVLNDCHTDKDLQKFLTGFSEFEEYVASEVKQKLAKLEPAEVENLLDYLAESPDRSKKLEHFYDTTKQLTVQHFTTSEYFLKNYLDFEFAPARYLGCVDISV